ncbi:hypothetical protein AB0M61_01785 [Streptomyces sp. NPDC051642]|uniref:hypothetical protein n=1 Tax=Streptomyces sp. NPDC051642 TaxID=3154646 RepID=UPI00343C2F57
MTTTYDPQHGDHVRIEGHGINFRGESRTFTYEGVIDRPYPDLPGFRLIGHNVTTGQPESGFFSSDEQMNTTPEYGQTTRPI